MCHHGSLAFAGWAMERTAHERDFDKDANGSTARSAFIRLWVALATPLLR